MNGRKLPVLLALKPTIVLKLALKPTIVLKRTVMNRH